MAIRTDEYAELKRQLDEADADIALVNKRFDESQGMRLLRGHLVRELDAHALLLVSLMQMVPLLWRSCRRNSPERKSKPVIVMRLPLKRLKS